MFIKLAELYKFIIFIMKLLNHTNFDLFWKEKYVTFQKKLQDTIGNTSIIFYSNTRLN